MLCANRFVSIGESTAMKHFRVLVAAVGLAVLAGYAVAAEATKPVYPAVEYKIPFACTIWVQNR